MVKIRNAPPRYATRPDLLAAGPAAVAWDYARASVDELGEEKSVTSQHRENGENAGHFGWPIARSFDDTDESGADPDRVEFVELMDAIARQAPDVLVLRMSSRAARDVGIYGLLRNHCLRHGVVWWLVGKTLYDLREPNDLLQLNIRAMFDEHFRAELIDATIRGHRDSAIKGRPGPGLPAFGYRRLYDPRSGDPLTQEPDDEVPVWALEPGGPWEAPARWTPHAVVRWLFAEAHAGMPLGTLAHQLNERRIPNPRTFNALQKGFRPVWRKGSRAGQEYGSTWENTTVRHVLLNRTYLGHRVYNGLVQTRDCWEPLVDEKVFHEVGESLRNPNRLTYRGARTPHYGAAKHHLTRIAICAAPRAADPAAVCELGLKAENSHVGLIYRCRRGHTTISIADMDNYVITHVVTKLVDLDLSMADVDDDELRVAEAAYAELRRERADIEAVFYRGKMTALVYERRIDDIDSQIELAKAEVHRLRGIPGYVAALAGPEAAQRFARLPLPARRKVLASCVEVRLLPVGRGWRVPAEQRVTLRWLLG